MHSADGGVGRRHKALEIVNIRLVYSASRDRVSSRCSRSDYAPHSARKRRPVCSTLGGRNWGAVRVVQTRCLNTSHLSRQAGEVTRKHQLVIAGVS